MRAFHRAVAGTVARRASEGCPSLARRATVRARTCQSWAARTTGRRVPAGGNVEMLAQVPVSRSVEEDVARVSGGRPRGSGVEQTRGKQRLEDHLGAPVAGALAVRPADEPRLQRPAAAERRQLGRV